MKVTADNFAAWNEGMAARYDVDLFYTHPSRLIRAIEASRIAAVLRLVAARPEDHILEVGCGAGHVLGKVACGTLTGVDLSEALLERAQQRLGDRAAILKGDAAALPFPDASFDKVFCTEVLEHVLDPAQVLAEIRRVLKPGGYAVVSVPNEPLINLLKSVALKVGFLRRILRPGEGAYQMADHMDDEWHLHTFTRAMLTEKADGLFRVSRTVAVPSCLLPLRYAARLDPVAAAVTREA